MKLLYILPFVLCFAKTSQAQSINDYVKLNQLLDFSMTQRDVELKRLGFEFIMDIDWAPLYYNELTEDYVVYSIEPPILVYLTEKRANYINILSGLLDNGYKQVPRPKELELIPFAAKTTYYKSTTHLYTVEEVNTDSLDTYTFTLGKMPAWVLKNDRFEYKKISDKKTETLEKKTDKKEAFSDEILNREPLKYAYCSFGVTVPVGDFKASSSKSTNSIAAFKGQNGFGGKVGIHFGYGGVFSPRNLNRNFRPNFDFSFKWAIDYAGQGYDQNNTTAEGYSYDYLWFHRASVGIGPALSFSNSDNSSAISFYYTMLPSAVFGGNYSLTQPYYNEKFEREPIANFALVHGFGASLLLSWVILGLEYTTYNEDGEFLHTIDNNSVITSSTVKSNFQFKQIVFKIAFSFE